MKPDGTAPAIDVEVGGRLVENEDRSRSLGGLEHRGALERGHRPSGRILEVRHQVGQHRQSAREGLLGAVEIPAVFRRHRHADQACVRSPQRVGGVRIGRSLDQHAIAATEQHSGEQVDRALGAGRDDDLVG